MRKFKQKVAAYGPRGIADPETDGVTRDERPLSMSKGPKKEAHTINTKHGMGDYYGTGFKAPIGKIRDSDSPGFIPVSPKKLKKPPKSIV